MAVVHVKHHPELTAEKAMEIFRKHFKNKYKVNRVRRLIGRQFVVQRTSLVGVFVGVKQENSKTSFVFNGESPSLMLTFLYCLLIGYLLAWLILKPKWKQMEEEIESFIRNAPEFK